MLLNDIMYLFILENGEVIFIERKPSSERYFNHHQYLDDVIDTHPFLKQHSFGLTMKNSNHQVMFYNYLTEDNTIVFQNTRVLNEEKVSAISFYLPSKITETQKNIVTSLMAQIDDFEFTFLFAYSLDTHQLESISESPDDLRNGDSLLDKYMMEHLCFKER